MNPYKQSLPSTDIPSEEKTAFKSFSAYAWQQFKKNKPAYRSLQLLLLLFLIALLAPLLANDKPLYCCYKNNHLFPAISFLTAYTLTDVQNGQSETISIENFDWKRKEYSTVVWPLLSAYAPGKSDIDNSNFVGPTQQQAFRKANGDLIVMPKRFKHWLGTNEKGSDLLSGLIHGTKYSLFIGISTMLIASFIGLLLGALAGYFGNQQLQTRLGSFIVFILGLCLAWFYSFHQLKWVLLDAFGESGLKGFLALLCALVLFASISAFFYWMGKLISQSPLKGKIMYIPVDGIISRVIETMNSLPVFIVIITFSAISRPSFLSIIFILGFTLWVPIARLTRAEFMRLKALDFVQACKSLGLSESRIILRHVLPNSLAPVFIQIAFGIGGVILVESTLSFIGVGVPQEIVTWGKLLSEGRQNFSAWWLVVFPGLALFTTVTIYNLIGDGLRDALDPRLKK